jgi:hypothetical protein
MNGKPRTVILEYLGTSETLLQRLREENRFSIKSYGHGDIRALLNAAIELDVVPIINKHVQNTKTGKQVTHDGLSVGTSFLLAAIWAEPAAPPVRWDGMNGVKKHHWSIVLALLLKT